MRLSEGIDHVARPLGPVGAPGVLLTGLHHETLAGHLWTREEGIA